MHGYVDLLYRDDVGAFHVLDYKTNRLGDYAPAVCAQAIAANDYDLQYLIYLVAVQRWLRLRLGDVYDPARHLRRRLPVPARPRPRRRHPGHPPRPPAAGSDRRHGRPVRRRRAMTYPRHFPEALPPKPSPSSGGLGGDGFYPRRGSTTSPRTSDPRPATP